MGGRRALQRPGQFRRRFGDADHGGTQQAVVQHVAGLQHLDDRAGRYIGAFGLEDRLMEIWSNRSPCGSMRRMPWRSTRRAIHAQSPRRRRAGCGCAGPRPRLRACVERTAQVIAAPAGPWRNCRPRISLVVALALQAAADVLGLGERAQQAVLAVREFGLDRGQPLLGARALVVFGILADAVGDPPPIARPSPRPSPRSSSLSIRRPIIFAV